MLFWHISNPFLLLSASLLFAGIWGLLSPVEAEMRRSGWKRFTDSYRRDCCSLYEWSLTRSDSLLSLNIMYRSKTHLTMCSGFMNMNIWSLYTWKDMLSCCSFQGKSSFIAQERYLRTEISFVIFLKWDF